MLIVILFVFVIVVGGIDCIESVVIVGDEFDMG